MPAAVSASAINLVVARILMQAGRHYHSITLEADAHHLMTDVWTSVGVVIGVAAVALTGWERLVGMGNDRGHVTVGSVGAKCGSAHLAVFEQLVGDRQNLRRRPVVL